MSDSHRLLLTVVTGFLLLSGVAVIVADQNEEPASAESPLLQVAATTTTTTLPPTTTTAPPETTVAPPPQVSKPEALAGGAVVPPKNSYAPEPIQEIGTIEIPKIGLRHKVMHGITLRNIDHGPSHWPGTPLPGEQGNVVFMGHRVTHSHPFRRINELAPGDEIRFDVAGVKSTYVVTGHEIVRPNRLDIVNPTPTPTLTIFACHPPGSARQRYVVRAALVEPVTEPPAAADATEPPPAGEAPPS
jgi:sortase A